MKRAIVILSLLILSGVACKTDTAKINSLKFLVIGDSNGEYKRGWVYQLERFRKNDRFYNASLSGNTIGFVNLGDPAKNTLLNVDRYLNSAQKYLSNLDAVLILLGTNDCKAVFKDSLDIVPQNMTNLISLVKKHPVYQKEQPQIYIISPPPIGPDEMLLDKYKGGAQRVKTLVPQFKTIAEQNECVFIDIHTPLEKKFIQLTKDGIHLEPKGQKLIAALINNKLDL